VLFECATIVEVVVKCLAGVVDEDVEGLDSLEGCLNLGSIGHVEGQRSDALIRVGQARVGVHPLRASPEGLLD
jgi:hypothetical protein